MKPGCRRRFEIFHLLGEINSPAKAFSQRCPVQFSGARGRNPDTDSTVKESWLGRDLAGSLLGMKFCTGNCPQTPVCCSPPERAHDQKGVRCLFPTLCKPSFLRNRIYWNFQQLDNKTAQLFLKNSSLRFLACCPN